MRFDISEISNIDMVISNDKDNIKVFLEKYAKLKFNDLKCKVNNIKNSKEEMLDLNNVIALRVFMGKNNDGVFEDIEIKIISDNGKPDWEYEMAIQSNLAIDMNKILDFGYEVNDKVILGPMSVESKCGFVIDGNSDFGPYKMLAEPKDKLYFLMTMSVI